MTLPKFLVHHPLILLLRHPVSKQFPSLIHAIREVLLCLQTILGTPSNCAVLLQEEFSLNLFQAALNNIPILPSTSEIRPQSHTDSRHDMFLVAFRDMLQLFIDMSRPSFTSENLDNFTLALSQKLLLFGQAFDQLDLVEDPVCQVDANKCQKVI